MAARPATSLGENRRGYTPDMFEQFFLLSPSPAFIADAATGRILRINPALGGLLGLDAEAVRGRRFLDFIHPEDCRRTWTAVTAMSPQQALSDFTNRIVVDGELRLHMQWNAFLSGDAASFFAVGRDVTPLIEARQRADDESARFASFMDNCLTPACIKDADGRLQFVNAAMQRVFELDDSILGQRAEAIWPADIAAAINAADAEVLASGRPDVRPEAIPDRDRVRHWVTSRFPVHTHAGPRLGSISLEVTDLIHSERDAQAARSRLRLALQAGAIGIWELDHAGGTLRWDDEYFDVFAGARAGAPETVAALLELVEADERPAVQAFISSLDAEGADASTVLRVRAGDGSMRWLSMHALTTRRDGTALHTIGIARDITTGRQADLAALEAKTRIEDACVASEQWVWEWDSQADTIEYFGETPAWLGELAGPQPWSVMSLRMLPGDRERQRQAMLAAVTSEDHRYACEYRSRGQDGSVHWVESRGRAIAAGAGHRIIGSSTDITERKQRELRLLGGEQQLRLVQDTARFWGWLIDTATGDIRYLGQPPPWEPAGLGTMSGFMERLGDADATRIRDGIAAATAEPGRIQSIEVRLHAADGAWFDVLVRGRALADADGCVHTLVGATLDLTEQRRREREQSRREAQIRLSQKIARFWTWSLDLQSGRLTNHGQLPPWAQDPERAVAEFFERLSDADQAAIEGAIARARLNPDESQAVEVRAHDPDGSACELLVRGQGLRDEDGKVTTIVGASLDITERKRAEGRLRLAQQAAGLWFWERDLVTDKVSFIGAAPPYVVGEQREFEADDISASSFPEDYARCEQLIREGLSHPDRELTLEYRKVWPDASIHWIEARARFELDAGGEPVRLVGASTDVTERREAQQRKAREETVIRMAGAAAGLAVWQVDPRTDRLVLVGEPPDFLPGAVHADTMQAFAALLRPQDRDRVLAAYASLGREDGQEEFETECALPVRAGAREPVWVRIHAIVHGGSERSIVGAILDITGVKQQQEKLLDNERQLRLAQLASRFWSWQIDIEADRLEFLGQPDPWVAAPVAERALERFMAATCESDRLPLQSMINHCVATPGEVSTCEIWQERGGDQRCLSVRGQCVVDPDGRRRLVGASMDITEHRRQSEALRASEQSLRSLIYNLPGVAFRLQPTEWGLWPVFVSRHLEALAGLKTTAMTSGRVNWDADIVHPDDRALAQPVRHAAIVAGETHYETSYRIITAQGGTRWVTERGHINYRDGAVEMIWGFTQDVTLQERSRQALQLVAESTTGYGQAFFDALVQALCQALGVRFALLASADPEDPERLRTLAIADQGRLLEGLSYPLAGSPCGQALTGDTCFYQGDAQARFPADELLRKMGVNSYLGTPLHGSDGNCLGVLVVMDSEHIDEDLMPQRFIELCAGRAASELERHLLDQQYHRSVANYRGVFHASGDPILVVDAESTELLDVNDAALAVYGYRREELLGTSAMKLSAEPDRSARELVQGAMRIPRRLHRRADGSVFPVEVSLARYQVDGRDVVASVVKDITARERSDQELRKSLATLKAILESTEEAILVTDRLGRITHFNDNFLRLWGLTENDVEGNHVQAVEDLTREHFQSPAPLVQRFDATPGGDGEATTDTVYLNDGRILEAYSQPLLLHGATIGRVFSQRNITERRLAAERLEAERSLLREMLDANPTFIFVKDRSSRYLLANHSLRSALGLKDGEIIGHTDDDLWGNRRVSMQLHQQDRRVLDDGEEVFVPEEQIFGANGEPIWVQTVKRPLRNPRGEIDRLLGVAVNITQRKLAERKLHRAVAELGLAEERERKHLAALLHDNIVQDLGLAKIKVGALRRGSWPPQQMAELNELTELLSSTIRASRGLLFEISPPVLYDFGITAALEWLLERVAADDGLAFELNLAEAMNDLPTDTQVMLFQIVRELVSNVRKHARAHRIMLGCTAGGGWLELRIEDDGAGFSPPARLVPSDKGGFGLVSIRDRVELLGGRFVLEAAPGEGTRVTLMIPRFAAVRDDRD